MIPCDFCEDLATYAYIPAGLVWFPFRESIRFCKGHLIRYYLGLHYGASDA